MLNTEDKRKMSNALLLRFHLYILLCRLYAVNDRKEAAKCVPSRVATALNTPQYEGKSGTMLLIIKPHCPLSTAVYFLEFIYRLTPKT